MTAGHYDIRRWSTIADRDRLVPALDAIFFEASATKSFADEAARSDFRERWLGRYLAHDPDLAFVALAADGRLMGYVIGATDDPATAPRFSDIGYFEDFAPLTARYPAQLHVNLDAAFRSQGVGRALVEVFCTAARARGVPGVHVVTARGMRNVAFYERAGFREAGRLAQSGGELLFLARAL